MPQLSYPSLASLFCRTAMADPVLCKQLEDAGAAAVMLFGSRLGEAIMGSKAGIPENHYRTGKGTRGYRCWYPGASFPRL